MDDLQDTYQYINALVEAINQGLNLFQASGSVSFCLKGPCYVSKTDQGVKLILSHQALKIAYFDGFKEYKSLRHIWTEQSYSLSPSGRFEPGDQSIWALVCHELAHIKQIKEGKFNSHKHHNLGFKSSLKTIIILYPYASVDFYSLLLKGGGHG